MSKQPEPRVSDDTRDDIVRHPAHFSELEEKLALDLQDSRAEVERLQELIAGRYHTGGRSEIDYQNELARKDVALKCVLDGWDALPWNQPKSGAMRYWIIETMASAIRDVRAALKPAEPSTHSTLASSKSVVEDAEAGGESKPQEDVGEWADQLVDKLFAPEVPQAAAEGQDGEEE